MSCNGFEKFSLDEWTEAEFAKHIETCESCRIAMEQDRKLLDLARSRKTNITAPFLWPRIETDLQQQRTAILKSDNYHRWFFRIAAILVLAIGISMLWFKGQNKQQSPLLTESTLKKVEQLEKDYENAINELEALVTPQLSQLNQELMLLYRDRLETIDAQIEQCKEALAMNPANAHIRSYLLAALRDKKATLREIIALTTT
ncbi:hypothetical protein EH223_12280 [candidate division KSB1 bacterium]|nr:hypothetical protein [candidate division KSB1 bacterium]RQW02602.1 MAG: hypothetical protein EH223_12280 [candidate division KSB1 bacterium]